MPMFGPMHAARMVGKNKRGAQRSASFVSRDGERRQHDSDWQREKTERVERLKRLRSASLASERWAVSLFLISSDRRQFYKKGFTGTPQKEATV